MTELIPPHSCVGTQDFHSDKALRVNAEKQQRQSVMDILSHELQPTSFFTLLLALEMSPFCGFYLGLVDGRH